MNLNDLQLNPQQIAALYSDVLIETDNIQTQDNEAVKFLGDNNKNICVLVFNNETAFLPDDQLSFLTTVLAACKLSLADIALINHAHAAVPYQKISEQLQSKVVLLFNVEPLAIDLPINFPHFQVQQFNGCTFLYAPSLQEIEDDKELKKKLWSSLKNIFDI